MDHFFNYGTVEMSFSLEPEIISRARKDSNLSDDDQRDLVFTILSNRKLFNAICDDENDTYEDTRNSINDTLNGVGLLNSEIKQLIADYDHILKPKSATETKIEQLQAQIDELRANLHKA